MAALTRQPFAELGTSRLHALQSAKNRQNALSPILASPLKPAPTPSTGKRQRAPEIFEDDADAENIDPVVFNNSPNKKSKLTGPAFLAPPSKFALTTKSAKPAKPTIATPTHSIRKALSSPSIVTSTPIARTRGSPKHNRVGALCKRRASSSPYRRIDPPSFLRSPALPFSIDAALSGTIKSYKPKAAAPKSAPAPKPAPAPVQHVSTLDDSMPKSWFFAIHEDTPEQEAANLMEHSASVLDISSDDDSEAKKLNEDLELGKENIPPPDFLATQQRTVSSGTERDVAEKSAMRPRTKKIALDAMDEDRRPLGDLPPEEFYAEGCDKDSYITVDVGIEKPSSLSREYNFTDKETSAEKASNSVPAVKQRKSSPANKPAIAVQVPAPVSLQKDDVPLAETDHRPDKSSSTEL